MKNANHFRACLEVAFGDKKCQFFDETRRFLKCIPVGTDEKSNEVSAKKGCFLAQIDLGRFMNTINLYKDCESRVTSKQALNAAANP